MSSDAIKEFFPDLSDVELQHAREIWTSILNSHGKSAKTCNQLDPVNLTPSPFQARIQRKGRFLE